MNYAVQGYTASCRPPNWRLIPDYMRGGMERWIENGVPAGSFMMAVLRNDLRGACEKADDVNQRMLFNYVQFLYSDAPSPCWGSPEKVNAWMEAGGLNGLNAKWAAEQAAKKSAEDAELEASAVCADKD